MVNVAVDENKRPQNRTSFRFLTSKFGDVEKECRESNFNLLKSGSFSFYCKTIQNMNI